MALSFLDDKKYTQKNNDLPCEQHEETHQLKKIVFNRF